GGPGGGGTNDDAAEDSLSEEEEEANGGDGGSGSGGGGGGGGESAASSVAGDDATGSVAQQPGAAAGASSGDAGNAAGAAGAAGAGGSGSGTADGETVELVAYWRRSELLSGGLALEEVRPAVVAALRLYAPDGDDAVAARWQASAMPWLGASDGEQAGGRARASGGDVRSATSAAAASVATAAADAEGGAGTSGGGGVTRGLDPIFEELRAGRGEGGRLDRWVQRHLGASVLARVAARRAAAAALLQHSGCLPLCRGELAAAAAAGDAAEAEEVRPGERTLQIWRAARQVTESAMRSKQTSGASFAVIADLLHAKADFLLGVRPCAAAIAVSAAGAEAVA
ncbi:unnamed protein product, partial [Phaeothamnion confervicola]